MDLGTTIVLVLGTTAVTAVANGIRAWLAKRQTAEISVSKDGVLRAAGLTSADAVRLAEIMAAS